MADTQRNSGAERQARWRRRHPVKARVTSREGQQRYRAREKATTAAKQPAITWPPPPADPAGALCEWAREKLIVPPGHKNSGQPFQIPAYLAAFFADALAKGTQEAALIIARKNAKSSGVAALLAASLLGPLRREGWRCGVASLSREKAHELRMQVEAIVTASRLEGIQFWRRSSPAITAAGGSVDVLSADRNAGAAAGYDLAVADEIGLMAEKHRPLVNSLRSSVSARGGKFLALSVWGDGPFVPEIVSRRDDPGVVIHVYQAPEGAALDDPAAWAAANPGLGSIKSHAYMVSESRRVLSSVADQSSFLALDLNRPGAPSREMVCAPADWEACVVPAAKLPPRSGPAFIGFDAGGSSSMTAAAAFWPKSKRLELFAAFPGIPTLAERGAADGVGASYSEACSRNELKVFADCRVTPVNGFVLHLASVLDGCEIGGAASDLFRRAEVQQAIEAEGIDWPWSWRRMGAGPQGSADVMNFQRAILRGGFRVAPSLLMPLALASTVLRRDGNGNPALQRGHTGRIDILSACVLAAGLAADTGNSSCFGVSRVAI